LRSAADPQPALARRSLCVPQAPEVKAKLVAQAMYPAVPCGADFAVFLRVQYDDFGRIIQEANIKAERAGVISARRPINPPC
jgi:hypothetical protein